VYDWSEYHRVEPFPLESSFIMFKTLHWNENTIDSFGDLETAMFIRESEAPYCEYAINAIVDLSNGDLCGTDSGPTQEVGYYVRSTFPNVYDGSLWCFHLPADFSEGGFVLLDGVIATGSAEAITSSDETTNDLSFCTEMRKGMHIIEVYGVSLRDSIS
jgi:hypothetical protein